jgi:hypothetical protein
MLKTPLFGNVFGASRLRHVTLEDFFSKHYTKQLLIPLLPSHLLGFPERELRTQAASGFLGCAANSRMC